MSLLKRIFGLQPKVEARSDAVAIDYKGYTITPAPVREGGQFRLAAVIAGTVGGERREHKLVRADLLPSADIASEQAIRKARLVIDEQGDRLFD